ncbi:MAG: helix-turn-helix domain-containing protein [Bacteroidaceae bacterium]|nr:helix-turn-helix domain-containing protein [Bacteroidaceae bacterium]
METFNHLHLLEHKKTAKERIERLGDDFCIYDISYQPPLQYPFMIDEYSCCLCLEGEAQGRIDLSPTCLKPLHLAVNIPGQLLELYSMSKNFRAIGITMSQKFVRELGLPYNFHLDRMLRNAPIVELEPAVFQSMLSYCSMVQRLLATAHPYRRESLRHLTCAFFYGFSSRFLIAENKLLSNEELIMKRFMAEVKKHGHVQRKVAFYADCLHCSACYLSTTIKKVSGKSPVKWIDEAVIKEACALLKSTNLTIQQISYQLGFPSQSFFGKFFKRIIGLSPKEYRTQ